MTLKSLPILLITAAIAGCSTPTVNYYGQDFRINRLVMGNGAIRSGYNSYSLTQAYLAAILDQKKLAQRNQGISAADASLLTTAVVKIGGGTLSNTVAVTGFLTDYNDTLILSTLVNSPAGAYGDYNGMSVLFGVVDYDQGDETHLRIFEDFLKRTHPYCLPGLPRTPEFEYSTSDVSRINNSCGKRFSQVTIANIDSRSPLKSLRDKVFFEFLAVDSEIDRAALAYRDKKTFGVARPFFVDGKRFVRVTYDGQSYEFPAPTKYPIRM